MSTIPIRDPLNQQRMFDLALDTNGKVIIVTKIGKLKVSTPLSSVINAARKLKPELTI